MPRSHQAYSFSFHFVEDEFKLRPYSGIYPRYIFLPRDKYLGSLKNRHGVTDIFKQPAMRNNKLAVKKINVPIENTYLNRHCATSASVTGIELGLFTITVN
jgi:hypothetical protein